MNYEEYCKHFDILPCSGTSFAGTDERKTRARLALQTALDIRKFEIELYWKRATYFWAFIAICLAGYATAFASGSSLRLRTEMLMASSCCGFVFSVAWFQVNQASKYWQENWEKHVDLLEDEFIGPLYKTVLSDKANIGWSPFRAYAFSVSKVNQLLSLLTVLGFTALIISSFIVGYDKPLPLISVECTLVALAIFSAIILICFGRSGIATERGCMDKSCHVHADARVTNIVNRLDDKPILMITAMTNLVQMMWRRF